VVVGDVELVPSTRTVFRDGKKVDLTSVEFAILETLLRMAGQVVSRENLMKTAMGRNLSAYDRSIDVHVSSLRKKLGHRTGEPELIKTVRNMGYMYTAES
jgi:two-component system response regulator CpxR